MKLSMPAICECGFSTMDALEALNHADTHERKERSMVQIRFVQGRCWRCEVAFRWKAGKGRRLKDTTCPLCGRTLSATAHYLKSVPWFSLDGSDTGIPRWVRGD